MTPAVLFLLHAAACPASAATPGSPGQPLVARLPAAEAMQLNREGKELYRQERWPEARAKYAAALAADSEMFGAQLNLACSFSRQGRYEEAAREAARLIRQAFVPWSREVDEAADLGILQHQAVYRTIQDAQAEAASAWGKAVSDGVFFIARTKPPVNLDGEGTLALILNQEVFAWIPRTGRYFQLTAEDGRVLAFAVSADRRRVVYLMARKLVRLPGQPALLRGLALRVLEIPTMTLGPKVSLPGDFRQVQAWYSSTAEVKVTDASGQEKGFKLDEQALVATFAAGPPVWAPSVVLTARGVAPSPQQSDARNCSFSLAPAQEKDGVWHIRVSSPHGKSFVLDARYGAGLAGLPFPDATRKGTAEDVRK